jgi:Zn-dependent peptidase ImmA (M78 family)
MKFTTPQEWKRAMVELAENDYRRLEWQANTFAGLLLVPPEPLRIRALELRQKMSEGGLNPDSLDRQGMDRVLRMLGQAFEVSSHVMRIRLSNDGLWDITYSN